MRTFDVYGTAMLLAIVATALPGCRPTSTAGPAGSVPSSAARFDSPPETARSPVDTAQLLGEACRWLWDRQADDGRWHSENYAVLRSGQAYTPFVLHCLLSVPEEICPRPAGGVDRALDFIVKNTDQRGLLGMADTDLPEYPNYSTAYALRCLEKVGRPKDVPVIERMRRYLIAEQYRPENGFTAESPVFGGWGFGGVRPPGEPGHMDLAHTRRVLQALRAAGVEDNQIYERAQAFLRLVQRHPSEMRSQPSDLSSGDDPRAAVPYDGGFYFSPVVLDANKGRQEPGDSTTAQYYRSYATTTCDGILSLIAAGVSKDDERIGSARGWLKAHPRLDYPEGIPTDHPDPWGDALHFYHLAVRAETYAALDWPGDWRAAIARQVALGRRRDGSYKNTASPLMKEDDAVLCTALVATALVHCL